MAYVGANISDIHFGAYDAKEMYRELKECFIQPLKKLPKLDFITINGDLYDYLITMDNAATRYSLKFMNDIFKIAKKKKCKVRLIHGTLSHDKNQLDAFKDYEYDDEVDVKIVNTVEEELLFPDFRVLYLPEEYVKDPKKYYHEFFKEDSRYNMIFGHGMVKEMSFKKQDSEIQMQSAPIFDITELNRICKGPIIFGHIHMMINLYNSLFYCGSPLRWCQGEDEPKGWLISLVNPDNSKFVVAPYYNVNARLYKTINIDEQLHEIDVEDITSLINTMVQEENIYKLRVQVTDNNVPTEKLMILKNYFSKNKFIDLEFKYKAIEVSKEKEKENNTKYAYLFDKGMKDEEKIEKFIKQHFNYELSSEKINKLLFEDNDIIKILNELSD